MYEDIARWTHQIQEPNRELVDSAFDELLPHVQNSLHDTLGPKKAAEHQAIDTLTGRNLLLEIDEVNAERHWGPLELTVEADKAIQRRFLFVQYTSQFHREMRGQESLALLEHLSDDQRGALADILAITAWNHWEDVPNKFSLKFPIGQKASRMMRKMDEGLRNIHGRIAGVENAVVK